MTSKTLLLNSLPSPLCCSIVDKVSSIFVHLAYLNLACVYPTIQILTNDVASASVWHAMLHKKPRKTYCHVINLLLRFSEL